MRSRAALVFVVALFLGAGLAVPQWLSAPPKVKEAPVTARLPTSTGDPTDRPTTGGLERQSAIAPPSLAKPGADAGDMAPVVSDKSNDNRVSEPVEASAQNTIAAPANNARVLDPRPIEQTPVPGSGLSPKGEAAEAPPPAVALAPLADLDAGSSSHVDRSPGQVTAAPPADRQQGAAAAPIEQTPLPASSSTMQPATRIPAWLTAHIGDQDGEITRIVLQRARTLYQTKVSEGQVKNACYFAMDATRPNVLRGSEAGRRFYIICEHKRLFRAISAGHGSGRKLKGIADFSNGRSCVKNFGNTLDSRLTAGGAYLTSETKTSFKGYYQLSAKKSAPFSRTFIQYDGEGDTANARERQIGGHAAETLKNVCRRKNPKSPYADQDGYVPFGKLVDYSSGRSDGCTSWSAPDAQQIISIVKGNPTTLYIYPEETDIDAVAAALAGGQSLAQKSLYWNKTCLKEIGSPKFWSSATLGPKLAQYKRDHLASPAEPLPICKK